MLKGSPCQRGHEASLRVLAGGTGYLGEDPGLASLHDAAVLVMMWSVLNAFLHGVALLTKAGIPAKAAAAVIQGGLATTAGWLAGYAEQIDQGAHPGDDSTIATHLAAMDHLIEESAASGISTELPAFIKAIAQRAVDAGHGAKGYTALIELFLSDRS
ncbi:hypothetical protein ABZ860_00015 [Microbispora sp. NPDC046973]|uniref:imine reductase family protein n=1 Tax=Microbispora sp. NPDC046973 TaxID=3155022 RepID=UPI0033CD8DBC